MVNSLNFNKKDTFIRIIFFLVGLLIMGLGISLLIVSNFGSGPWDAVNIGLSNILDISIGACMNLVAVIQLIIGGILNKKIPNFYTLITSVFLGLFIDFWMLFLGSIIVTTLIYKFLMFMLALVVVSLGISIYLVSNLPNTPLDYFMLAIKSKLNLSLMIGKITSESIGFLLAILLGGNVGVGSIIVILAIGPMMQVLQKPCINLYDKILNFDIKENLA
ncbi:hypothetical protein CHF27_003400 [Romboutsia maritimum]|uniref:YitT family protein n=1 Tax=Romboutsia maritimum TaxID=2020948 RepID=A0A371IVA8_9FIRM|nr:hypothetical protein [Romboutsia maritimum]RDY24414.1 hypothetical protein CHF27_003400 [Romboutsia maritimum]